MARALATFNMRSIAMHAARSRPRPLATIGLSTMGLAGLTLLAACGFAYPVGAARAKPIVLLDAQRDLDCPERDIRVVEGLGGTFEAVGCGRVARYKAACDGTSCVVHRDDGPPVPFRDRPAPGDTPR